MSNRILELTEKIYNEGVIKAKEDADLILVEAKKKANEIIKSALKQEIEIIERAKKQAFEDKKNIDAEIQLAALQFTSHLKQQIANTIATAQIKNPIMETFQDTEFVKKIIATTIQNWNPQKPEELDIKILLPEKDEKEFANFLKDKTIDTLNKGITIKFDAKTKNGFKIGPKDGQYIVSFTENDFENYFKSFVRENTRKLLFDSEK